MNELFPLFFGVVLGVIAARTPLRRARRAVRYGCLGLAAVLLGGLATVITGEFRLTWELVLFDIPLVCLSASATALLAGQTARRRGARWAEAQPVRTTLR